MNNLIRLPHRKQSRWSFSSFHEIRQRITRFIILEVFFLNFLPLSVQFKEIQSIMLYWNTLYLSRLNYRLILLFSNYSNEKGNICHLVTLERRLLIVKPIQSARTIKTTKELPLNYLNSLSSPIRHDAEAISNLRISCSILEGRSRHLIVSFDNARAHNLWLCLVRVYYWTAMTVGEPCNYIIKKSINRSIQSKLISYWSQSISWTHVRRCLSLDG